MHRATKDVRESARLARSKEAAMVARQPTSEQTPIRISRMNEEHDLVIHNPQWLVEFFFRADPSSTGTGSYDDYIASAPPNRILEADIHAINRTMGARSPVARWSALTEARDLPWLTLI